MGTPVRTYDVSLVLEATDAYKKDITGFYPAEWLEDRSNVALINDNEDVALFTRDYSGVVTGHYFFFSRGREALTAARVFLKEAFTGDYDIEVIRGLTPLANLGARWMNKQLKFKFYGVVNTSAGPCELVILTKKEWETING